jgi:hypothetical protein
VITKQPTFWSHIPFTGKSAISLYCCTQCKQTFFLDLCALHWVHASRIFYLIPLVITKQLSDHSSNSSRIRTLYSAHCADINGGPYTVSFKGTLQQRSSSKSQEMKYINKKSKWPFHQIKTNGIVRTRVESAVPQSL